MRSKKWRTLGFLAIAALPLGLIAVAFAVADVPLGFFLRDPTTSLGGHPLTGAVSSAGVLLWWTAVTACGLAAVLNHRDGGPARTVAFFTTGGVLAGLLALDDLFLVHDYVGPRHLGIPEPLVLALLGGVGLIFLVAFSGEIRQSRAPWFMGAVILFGLSLGVDCFQARFTSSWRIFVEDGLKWLGIFAWTTFFVLRSLDATTGLVGSGEAVDV